MKNQTLKDAGKFASHVLLAAYLANTTAGSLTFFEVKNGAYRQYLKKSQRRIVAENLIPTEEVYRNIEENPTALKLIKAAHFQVQEKIDYEEDKRTLDDALKGKGNCVSYSGLAFAAFANVLEEHPEFRKFEKDVRLVQGIDSSGMDHAWLEVRYNGEFVGIEATSDYDTLSKYLIKRPENKSTRFGDLLADYSEFNRTKTIGFSQGKISIKPHYLNVLLPKTDFVHFTLNEVLDDAAGKEISKTKVPFSLYLMAGLNAASCLNARRKRKKNERKNARKR